MMIAFCVITGWLLVTALIWWLVLYTLRDEPTAHGQIVGRQLGSLIAFFWPLVLVYLVLLLVVSVGHFLAGLRP